MFICSLKICELFSEKRVDKLFFRAFFIWISTRKLTSSVLGWDRFCVGVQRKSDRQTERERERERWRQTRWRQQSQTGWSCRWRTDFEPSRTRVSTIMRSSAEAPHTHKPWRLQQTDLIHQNTTTLNLNRPPFCPPPSFRVLPHHKVFDWSGWKPSIRTEQSDREHLKKRRACLYLVRVSHVQVWQHSLDKKHTSAGKKICYVSLRFWSHFLITVIQDTGHRYATLRYMSWHEILFDVHVIEVFFIFFFTGQNVLDYSRGLKLVLVVRITNWLLQFCMWFLSKMADVTEMDRLRPADSEERGQLENRFKTRRCKFHLKTHHESLRPWALLWTRWTNTCRVLLRPAVSWSRLWVWRQQFAFLRTSEKISEESLSVPLFYLHLPLWASVDQSSLSQRHSDNDTGIIIQHCSSWPGPVSPGCNVTTDTSEGPHSYRAYRK